MRQPTQGCEARATLGNTSTIDAERVAAAVRGIFDSPLRSGWHARGFGSKCPSVRLIFRKICPPVLFWIVQTQETRHTSRSAKKPILNARQPMGGSRLPQLAETKRRIAKEAPTPPRNLPFPCLPNANPPPPKNNHPPPWPHDETTSSPNGATDDSPGQDAQYRRPGLRSINPFKP